MFDHLKGQFAFCLWDSRTNEVILARDRSGICPLYYTVVRHDDTQWLMFASEIKALLASGLVEAKADVRGLNHIFTFFAMPGPVTVFKGITGLVHGRYLHFKVGANTPEEATRQKIYWQVSYPDRGEEDYGSDEGRVVDEFERVLYTAVQRRLRADVPVVSYLSGGVDSSLVVAMSNKALGRPIPTFTISIQAAGLNEESEAIQAAKVLGCDPIIVNCGADELRTTYPELIAAAEFPVIDTSCVGLLQLAKAVHQRGYKVALTGEGADEWLAGYSWFKINKLTGFLDKIPGVPLGYALRKLFTAISGQRIHTLRQYKHPQKLLGGPNGWLDLYGIMSLNKLRFFNEELREQILFRSAFDDLELPAEMKRWHPFHRQMYVGSRVMLPGHLLSSKGDRIAMHSSVETRYAFLDEDVIAYMSKLHPRWKLRGLMKDKFVERKVAERWLPKDIAFRRKHMFRAPMDSWNSVSRDAQGSANDSWIDQVLSSESIVKAGYFDAEAVAKARLKLPTMRRGIGRTSLEMGLTAVTATQLWHHLYLGGGLCDIPSQMRNGEFGMRN